METILNLYATASGLWAKVAVYLPLVGGAGSVLVGAGGLLVEVSHAANAAAVLAVFQGLQSDPNTALIVAGLTALGLHAQHQATKAAIAAVSTPKA